LADKPKLIIYTLQYCPNCETLKEYLNTEGISCEEKDMSCAESLTDLRVNGIFVSEAPVLRSGSSFLVSRDLFAAGTLNKESVRKLSEGS
jgi:glutaredoxin